MANGSTIHRTRLLGALTVACAAASATVAAYSVHAGMPYNTVHLPFEEKLAVSFFFPQGWKFFTRDAREERVEPVVILEGGHVASASLGVNGERANLFGLRRGSRAQSAEMGLLLAHAKGATWGACDAVSDACLATVAPFAAVKNESPRPTLCGSIGFVKQRPVPWAWAHGEKPTAMPALVLRLDVQC